MLNFFLQVLASNPGEVISEKGMWRSSVIPCLMCISVMEVAQEIWYMASIEEWRRLWGSVVAEDGMGCRLGCWHTAFLCFPESQAGTCSPLAKFACVCVLWLYTLSELSLPLCQDSTWWLLLWWYLLTSAYTQHNLSPLWCWCSCWMWWCFHKAQTFILHLVPLNSAHHSVNTNTSL